MPYPETTAESGTVTLAEQKAKEVSEDLKKVGIDIDPDDIAMLIALLLELCGPFFEASEFVARVRKPRLGGRLAVRKQSMVALRENGDPRPFKNSKKVMLAVFTAAANLQDPQVEQIYGELCA